MPVRFATPQLLSTLGDPSPDAPTSKRSVVLYTTSLSSICRTHGTAPPSAPPSAPYTPTSCFGPSPSKVINADATDPGEEGPHEQAPPAEGEAEMSGALPKLGAFYGFFSFAHLVPPLQFVRRAAKIRKEESPAAQGHVLFLELCSGKLLVVEACSKGFYSIGKHRILCHNLVHLLRWLSRAFDQVYEDLMKAFIERNKVVCTG